VDLQGKVAVITGASAGIGAETARELSRAGCKVVLTARRLELLEALAAELAGPAVVLAADIADPPTADRLLALARESFGGADILINNAAVMAGGSIEAADLDALAYMIRVNFEAVVRSSYVFARAMKAQASGAIVNVSSIGAYLISRRGGVYGGLKHALEAFTASLRIELAGSGVKVGTIAPGSTATEMFATMMGGVTLPDHVPLEPLDVAAAIRFMLEQPDRSNIVRMAIYPSTETN
jgi:NADP-dependent 3-hydroxy acid dehydrogenase YdfG